MNVKQIITYTCLFGDSVPSPPPPDPGPPSKEGIDDPAQEEEEGQH